MRSVAPLVAWLVLAGVSPVSAQTEPVAPLPDTPLAIPDAAPTAHAEHYRLENGLDVVLDPCGGDTVTVAVSYHVGSSSQSPGWTSLAHLAEHVMFEGSAHAPGHFLERMDELGAIEVNGYTSRDQTFYYEVLPREHLERVLFLEADRMAFLLARLDEAHFRTQREVVMREREERVDVAGLGLVPGLLAGVLYPTPGHPYADLREHREDTEAIRLADVQWFLSTYYAPDDATLVVTGAIDVEATRAIVARFFGPIRRIGPAPAPLVVPEVARLPVERRLVVEANVRRDQLSVFWPTPAFGSPEHAALELIAAHLGARLRETLVDRSDATQLDVSEGDSELVSELEVRVTTGRREGTLEALEALDAELAALAATPLDAHALARLTWLLFQSRLAELESSVQRADLLGRRSRLAPDGHWSLAWDLARWQAVTPEQAAAVVRDWLPQRHRLVLSLAARHEAPFEGRVVVDLSFDENGEEISR